MKKIMDFLTTIWHLFLFAIKTFWVMLRNNEAKTYKEEREQQKKKARQAQRKSA